MPKFARVRLIDCFVEQGVWRNWAADISEKLDSLTVQPNARDVVIYCAGSWPEKMPLTSSKVVMDFVEDLPPINPDDILSDVAEPVECSEGLAEVYYMVLKGCQSPMFDVVRSFAQKTSPKKIAFSAVFSLGRHLKALDEEASHLTHKQAVQLFCLLQNRQFAHHWALYEEKYERIQTSTDAEVAFDNIVELARANPYPCDDRSDMYQETVAVAYQLSQLRESREFYFPPGRFKQVYNMESYLLSRFKQYMQDEGFIALVNPDFQFGPTVKKAKCQLWKWIGPDLRESA